MGGLTAVGGFAHFTCNFSILGGLAVGGTCCAFLGGGTCCDLYILCDGRFFRWHNQNFFGSGPQKLFLCNQTLKNLTCFAFILDASSGYYQIQKKRKEKFLEEYKRETVGSLIFPYPNERLNKVRNHLRKN